MIVLLNKGIFTVRIALLKNYGLSFLLSLSDYCAELLANILKSKFTWLSNHHHAAFSVTFRYKYWLAICKKDSVWKQDLTAFYFFIWGKQVLD